MECPLLEEIVIVWNNEESPQDAGFRQLKKWKHPVLFHQTPHNSMDFRYSLPPESKAKLFFNADDDLIFTCEKLVKAFQKWKKYYIGDIVPLLGYRTMSFNFKSENGQFDVKNFRVSPTFRQTLIGLTWISRHFLDLYNANRTREVQQIRKIVAETNNCDDLAMNFIVNHFYRDIHSVQIDYDDVMIDA